MTDGTNLFSKTGLTSMVGAARKRASSWGVAGQFVTGDGAAPATAAFDGNIGSTVIYIGTNTSANQWFGTIRNVRIGTTQLSAAQLQAMTS